MFNSLMLTRRSEHIFSERNSSLKIGLHFVEIIVVFQVLHHYKFFHQNIVEQIKTQRIMIYQFGFRILKAHALMYCIYI